MKLKLTVSFFVLSFLAMSSVWAYNLGDYRTTSNAVTWDDAAKWQVYTSFGWVAADTCPTYLDADIYINHTVWLIQPVTADQIIVGTGADFKIYGDLSLNDGTGDDLAQNAGSITLYSGIYRFNTTSPTIKVNTGSTFTWASNNLGQGVTLQIQSGATLNLSAAGSDKLNEGAIINYGTINWLGANLTTPSSGNVSGSIDNYGTFNITSDNSGSNYTYLLGQLLTNYATGVINITLPAVAPTGTVYFNQGNGGADCSFDNLGAVNIYQGRLNNMSTGTSSGSFFVDANAMLDFWTATFTFNNATFSGTGYVRKYADWVLASNISIPNPFFYWSSGLTGNYTLTVADTATLYGCTIDAGSTLEVGSTGRMTFATFSSRTLNGTILNNGIIHWLEGELSNGFINPLGSVINNSTFNMSPTTGDIYFYGVNFTNSLTGVLNKNKSNAWYLSNMVSGATFDVNSGSVVNVKSGTFYLQINSNFNGELNTMASGTLSIGGTLTSGLSFKGTTVTNNGLIANNPIIMQGNAYQHLEGEGYIHRLKIDNANNVSLDSDHTVTILFDLTNGQLILGDNTLFLGTSSVINASGSSYVNTNGLGVVDVDASPSAIRLIPVGSTTSYTPLQLEFGATDNALEFKVRCFDGVYLTYDVNENGVGNTVPNNCVQRTWIVTPEPVSASNLAVNVTAYWNASDETVDFDRNTNVSIRHFNGATWDAPAGGAATTSGGLYAVSRYNMSSFSPIAVGGGGVFPVELVALTGDAVSQGVELKWQTASEKNALAFEVERQTSPNQFRKIGKVNAVGNSSQLTNYQFLDETPINGVNYYRLKQTDIDGQFVYSEIITVNYHATPTLVIAANPFQNELTFKVYAERSQESTLIIADFAGKKLIDKVVFLEKGFNEFHFPTQTWASGVYLLNMPAIHSAQGVKLVKE